MTYTTAKLDRGQKRVVAALVLYRTPDVLLSKCLRSLASQDIDPDITLQFAFLDNDQGSSLPLLDRLVGELDIESRVIFREAGPNVGFGAGHNQIFGNCGQEFAGSGYHLCVNPDSLYHHRAVSELVRFASERSDAGLFEARQFPREHPKVYSEKDGLTDWCSGCALLVPNSVYRQLGGFDPSFFMYCEDVDLSWRARLAGFSCHVVQRSHVYHDVHREDRDMDFERRHMIVSGYRLAVRFGGNEFARGLLDEARKFLRPDEITALMNDVRPVVSRGPRPSFDFHHGFTFSEARW